MICKGAALPPHAERRRLPGTAEGDRVAGRPEVRSREKRFGTVRCGKQGRKPMSMGADPLPCHHFHNMNTEELRRIRVLDPVAPLLFSRTANPRPDRADAPGRRRVPSSTLHCPLPAKGLGPDPARRRRAGTASLSRRWLNLTESGGRAEGIGGLGFRGDRSARLRLDAGHGFRRRRRWTSLSAF